MLVELGYSIVAVAERLGDTVEVAMATYSHLYPDKKQGMADDLDRRARGEPPAGSSGTASLEDVSERLEQTQKGHS